MLRAVDILVIDKIRKIKKIISNHKLLTISVCIGLFSCFWTTSIEDILYLKHYIVYATWIANIYLGLKIINPTQGANIDYQLVELKLITRREFKFLIAAKLYSVGLIIAVINSFIIKEKIILVLLLLNCVVNVYVFLRSSYKSHLLDLIMVIYVCACIYLNSVLFSGIGFALMTVIFINLKVIHYEVLLPLYRVIYRISLRYTGEILTDTENDEISTEAERLLGSEKSSSITWCQNFFENKYKFYWMKEIVRISYDKEGYVLRIMLSLLICISVFYLPEWYGIFAVLVNIFTAYDFCHTMYREDAKLFPYGFIDKYDLGTILKRKLPIYSIVCVIMMLPMIIVLKEYSWTILCISVLVPALGIVKSFSMLLKK